jgi:adenylate cyclase
MKDLTLMFCDLRGFTTISEMFKNDPIALTTLINRFLTPMTDFIQGTGGTIDKYIGDCIMAFWNAPLDVPAHQAAACRAALMMRSGMKALNTALEAEAQAANRPHVPLAIGIGLNSGEVCVGNMGSDQKLNYSVLGDAVNLASRLEGQSKTYHLDLVIGETTHDGVRDFACIELDLIKVKGKNEPVRIFTIVGDEAEAKSERFRRLRANHERMLACYRAQDIAGARAGIAACLEDAEAYDLPGLYEEYAARLDAMEQDPPGPGWDGVFVAKSK